MPILCSVKNPWRAVTIYLIHVHVFLFSKVELFFCFEILDLNQNKWIYQTADICGFTPNFHDFIALVTLSTVGSTLVQALSCQSL